MVIVPPRGCKRERVFLFHSRSIGSMVSANMHTSSQVEQATIGTLAYACKYCNHYTITRNLICSDINSNVYSRC